MITEFVLLSVLPLVHAEYGVVGEDPLPSPADDNSMSAFSHTDPSECKPYCCTAWCYTLVESQG